MAIKISRYIDIVSAVGAGTNVGNRELIGRFFDDNPLIPTGHFVTFDNADDVASYFGDDSEEYARALFWFGWISKEVTNAKAMSFARWNSAASAPQIFGAKGQQAIASYQGISTGSFTLSLGGTSHTLTGLNFTAVTSLSDVAAVVQQAIRAQSGTMWTAATVVWNNIRQSFDFTGGSVGAAAITVTAGVSNDVAGQLGWLSATAILSDGAGVQTITQVLAQSSNADNNFGSFAFMATLSQDEIVEAATWNDAQNNDFLYSVPVTANNASAISAAVLGLSGVTLTLSPFAGQYAEQAPMMVEASTDYTNPNSVQNYMYQLFPGLTASVTTDADADTYDNLRVNYIGQTQSAGSQILFYQRGYMMGGASDALDQNTYVNEIWLKDASAAAIMTVLLDLTELPANSRGVSILRAVLQGVIDQAVNNGVISVGKTLTEAQKLYINQITNDPLAWKQVQNLGYWVGINIVTVTVNSIPQKKAVYTLIYSKDDVIRKVEGRDILI